VVGREQGYLGVLVDDLITRGTKEPYRMFTSRAEHRLILREDNADARLTPIGRELGLVDDERWQAFCDKQEAIDKENTRLQQHFVRPNTKADEQIKAHSGKALSREYRATDILKRPEFSYKDLMALEGVAPEEAVDEKVAEQIEIQYKYAGYVTRQTQEIASNAKSENTRLPEGLDYSIISGLSNELIQKLSDARPETLGQASRVPGITPAAISLLRIYLKSPKRGDSAKSA